MAETRKDHRLETRTKKTAIKMKVPKPTAQRPIPPAPSGEAPSETKKASKKPESTHHISAEKRWNMIAEAAYYIAEKRGFGPGHPAEDWAAAEAEIEAQLTGRKK